MSENRAGFEGCLELNKGTLNLKRSSATVLHAFLVISCVWQHVPSKLLNFFMYSIPSACILSGFVIPSQDACEQIQYVLMTLLSFTELRASELLTLPGLSYGLHGSKASVTSTEVTVPLE